MATFDLVIRGGTVIDGSGAERQRADVAVSRGRIAQVKRKIAERGAEEVDASGLIVAPGFIDSHTHLDAQLFWDPLGTPSSWNGSTTMVIGNCGLGLAPIPDGDPDYGISLMAGVEQIPRSIIERNVHFRWRSFGEYLNALDERGLGINVAALVPQALLRHAVLGDRAFGSEALEESELLAQRRMLDAALDDGALGISFNRGGTDLDDRGRLVAGNYATWEEIEQLASALAGRSQRIMAGLPGWTLENDPSIEEDELQHWIRVCKAAGAAFAFNPFNDGKVDRQLEFLQRANDAGAKLIGLGLPMPVSGLLSFEQENMFSSGSVWGPLFQLSCEARLQAFSDENVRARLRAVLCDGTLNVAAPATKDGGTREELSAAFVPRWDNLMIVGAPPEPFSLQRPSIGAMAAKTGRHPVDILLDALVSSHLRAVVIYFPWAPFDAARALRIMRDRNVLATANDTGAHLLLACQVASTVLLGNYVRRMELMTLEEAVYLLTGKQADALQFHDRGRLALNQAADLVLFDADTVDACAPGLVSDIPGGGRRFVQRGVGIERVIVAGTTVLREGRETGALPGRVLRRGRD